MEMRLIRMNPHTSAGSIVDARVYHNSNLYFQQLRHSPGSVFSQDSETVSAVVVQNRGIGERRCCPTHVSLKLQVQ